MYRILTTAFVGALGALALSACTNAEHSSANMQSDPSTNSAVAASSGTQGNPLLTPSSLPFHAPEFDKIKPSDFKSAILQGMAEHLKEVEAIANNPAPPTFENTLIALEKSGQLLNRAMMTFSVLAGADTNPTLIKTRQELAPKLAAHRDKVLLNEKLWERVRTIWNERDSLDLGPEDQRLLTVYHRRFVHAGAKLPDADQAKLKELNQKAATLSATFSKKLLEANKHGALVVSDKSKLAGLSDARIEAAAKLAEKRGLKGKWVIPLQNTTQQPILASLDNRAVRKQLFMNSWTRAAGDNDWNTRDTVAKLAKVRAQKAKLLGYPNYAAWKLVTQMAKTPENVMDFMGKLVGPVTAKAKQEKKELQQLINTSGKHFELQPWDWFYYAEKLREKKYGIDQDDIKPYFEFNNVLEKGVFYAANQLYGLTFERRHDLPVWEPGVRVYTVFDKDGSPLGLYYLDLYKRDNKRGGAWMSEMVGQSKLLGTLPVVYNVLNVPEPVAGEPTLLTFDEVHTLFHEFGHALNGFFSNVKYPSLSGTARARDFVEFPSQFNEHWALYPEILKNYAIHYKTGEPMPQSLIDKLKESRHFNAGYGMGELVAAAELDMQWHMLPASAPLQNVAKFGPKALKKVGIYMEDVPPRYRSSYFNHIWGSGYAAGYYAYLWTEMLADDAYQWFLDHGGLTRENGNRYRKLILARGSSVDPAEMWRQFYGGPPKIGPMIKFRGLSQSTDSGK
ncbi:MAG: M3 family metallopeptidase [Gammaproteobacteria bacterium]|nr:M3 family metallopeptidase [Gammaproteobacteria bacterium]